MAETLQHEAVTVENSLDLVGASVGHRTIVLGFVDREGGLCRVCGSIRVSHSQSKTEHAYYKTVTLISIGVVFCLSFFFYEFV